MVAVQLLDGSRSRLSRWGWHLWAAIEHVQRGASAPSDGAWFDVWPPADQVVSAAQLTGLVWSQESGAEEQRSRGGLRVRDGGEGEGEGVAFAVLRKIAVAANKFRRPARHPQSQSKSIPSRLAVAVPVHPSA